MRNLSETRFVLSLDSNQSGMHLPASVAGAFLSADAKVSVAPESTCVYITLKLGRLAISLCRKDAAAVLQELADALAGTEPVPKVVPGMPDFPKQDSPEPDLKNLPMGWTYSRFQHLVIETYMTLLLADCEGSGLGVPDTSEKRLARAKGVAHFLAKNT